MNDKVKVRKLTFDNDNPKHTIQFNDREKNLFGVKSIQIQLLEIESDNPSDLIILVSQEANAGRTETQTYLFQHRAKMIFQNNKYILDFNYPINVANFYTEIEIVTNSESPFTLTAYYSCI